MPSLQFGGGTVGEGAFSTPESITDLLETLTSCKINHIDTAPVYTATSPGASERLLGTAKLTDRGFNVNTKIKVTGDGPGQGSLRKEAIDQSLSASLTALGVVKV